MSTVITMETVEEYLIILKQTNMLSDFEKKDYLFNDAVYFYCNQPNGEYTGYKKLIESYYHIGSSTNIIDLAIEYLRECEKDAKKIADLIVKSENTLVTPLEVFKLQMRLSKLESFICHLRESVK